MRERIFSHVRVGILPREEAICQPQGLRCLSTQNVDVSESEYTRPRQSP